MSIIYKYLIMWLIVGGIIGSFLYLTHEVRVLKQQTSDQSINIKAIERGMSIYVDQNGKLHTQSVQMQESLAQLKESKDSTTQSLLALIKKSKIKANTVTQVGQVDTRIKDDKTIALPVQKANAKDTIYDFSYPPYVTNIVTVSKDSARDKLEIKDTISVVFHTHKETVNPPKKFFVLRWFQRKQLIDEVDILHSNPHVQTTNQKFINVIK